MAFENAVVVESIAAERAYIAERPCVCGGAWQTRQQALLFDGDRKPYDQILVTCSGCGASDEFWFDVSEFFGKPSW